MEYQEFVIKAREYKKKYQERWFDKLLKDEKALIKQEGIWKVAIDYPVLQVRLDNKYPEIIDAGGNMIRLKELKIQIQSSGKSPHIVWLPKKYAVLNEYYKQYRERTEYANRMEKTALESLTEK